MKKILQLFALFIPALALGQTAVQKVGGGGTDRYNLSNGNVVVPSGVSITATGTGVIAATSIPSLSINTTAPLVGGGALSSSLTLSMPASTNSVNGYLTSADHTTFAAKESALTFSAPLSRSVNTISIPVATTSVNGYLSSTDWTTFNAKQPAGNYITALTGDGTAAGPGSAVLTLASVISASSVGSSTAIPVLTYDAKGRLTLTSTAAVIAPAGTLTGTTLASNVVTSSLTTVGTIGTGVWQGTVIAGQYGGTGVANTGKTITIGGNLTTSGAFTTTLTATANTTITMPVTGTLATLAGAEALTNKTYNGNTWTAGTGTLTIAAGKTLTQSNTLTFTGTDSSSVNFGAGGTVLYSGGSYVSSITGTAGQITASASTGAVTLSVPTAVTGVNSITSVSATDLTLTGNAGASLVLGQGTNGSVTATPLGSGSILFGRTGVAAVADVYLTNAGTVNGGGNPAISVVQNTSGLGTVADLVVKGGNGGGSFWPAMWIANKNTAGKYVLGVGFTAKSTVTTAGSEQQDLLISVQAAGAASTTVLTLTAAPTVSATIGVAQIGTNTDPAATFAHSNVFATANSYALKQDGVGTTYLNSASGRSLNLQINNSNLLSFTSSLATFTPAVSISATTSSTNSTSGSLLIGNGSAATNVGIGGGNIRAGGVIATGGGIVYFQDSTGATLTRVDNQTIQVSDTSSNNHAFLKLLSGTTGKDAANVYSDGTNVWEAGLLGSTVAANTWGVYRVGTGLLLSVTTTATTVAGNIVVSGTGISSVAGSLTIGAAGDLASGTTAGQLQIALTSAAGQGGLLQLSNRSTTNGSYTQITARGLTNASAEYDYAYQRFIAVDTTAKTGRIIWLIGNGGAPAEQLRLDSAGLTVQTGIFVGSTTSTFAGSVTLTSLTFNSSATNVADFTGLTKSGTSTTAAAILGKSMGLTENLYVGNSVTVIGVAGQSYTSITGVSTVRPFITWYSQPDNRTWYVGAFFGSSNGFGIQDHDGGYNPLYVETGGAMSLGKSGSVTTIAGSLAIASTTEATTGGAGSLTTAGGIYATKSGFFGGPVVHKNYTVATLPAAATYPYGVAFVTDATLTTITGLGLAPTGGGANKVPVYSDGTSWLML